MRVPAAQVRVRSRWEGVVPGLGRWLEEERRGEESHRVLSLSSFVFDSVAVWRLLAG